MLEFNSINYLAMVLAWLVSVGLGAFWYSPMGFAKQWVKHTGIDIMKMPQNEATQALVAVAFSAFLQVFVLAVVINSLHITTATNSIIAGLVLWLGLIAATTVGTTLYSRRSWSFWWLNSSYFLVTLTINSLILSLWH